MTVPPLNIVSVASLIRFSKPPSRLCTITLLKVWAPALINNHAFRSPPAVIQKELLFEFPLLQFEAPLFPFKVVLIEKAKDDVVSFVAPWYSSTSTRFIYSSPLLVLLEITTQLFPTGHNEIHNELSPDMGEVYPTKQVKYVVGLEEEGLEEEGLDDEGLDEEGLEEEGLDEEGTEEEGKDVGLDDEGLDEEGLEDVGLDDEGLDEEGLEEEGLDEEGTELLGVLEDGFELVGILEEGTELLGLLEDGLLEDGIDEEGFDVASPDQVQVLPVYPVEQNVYLERPVPIELKKTGFVVTSRPLNIVSTASLARFE